MNLKIALSFLLAVTPLAVGQGGNLSDPSSESQGVKYGALAVDRGNGFYYGWSSNQDSQAAAEQRAIAEGNKVGGNCTVVLSYSGTGFAVYRTIPGEVGTAYGWGVASTKEAADAIATKECLKRSNGIHPRNFVWSENASNGVPLKEIYNASGEIESEVRVGNQIWTSRNLDVDRFRNGDPIPEAKDAADMQRLCKQDKPAFLYYNFDRSNGRKFGKLYNFHAVIDPRGLAPRGWKVPTQSDFEQLIATLGGENAAGKKLRSTVGWDTPSAKYNEYSGNGTNESGLNFLPGGRAWENKYSEGINVRDVFPEGHGSHGSWWSSTIDGPTRYNENQGYGYYNNGFSLNFSSHAKNLTYLGSDSPHRGFSVRLLKTAEEKPAPRKAPTASPTPPAPAPPRAPGQMSDDEFLKRARELEQ